MLKTGIIIECGFVSFLERHYFESILSFYIQIQIAKWITSENLHDTKKLTKNEHFCLKKSLPYNRQKTKDDVHIKGGSYGVGKWWPALMCDKFAGTADINQKMF